MLNILKLKRIDIWNKSKLSRSHIPVKCNYVIPYPYILIIFYAEQARF